MKPPDASEMQGSAYPKDKWEWAALVNRLARIIVDGRVDGYVSSNDLDYANDALDAVIPLLGGIGDEYD